MSQHPRGLVGKGEVHDGSVVVAGYSVGMFLLPLGRVFAEAVWSGMFSF